MLRWVSQFTIFPINSLWLAKAMMFVCQRGLCVAHHLDCSDDDLASLIAAKPMVLTDRPLVKITRRLTSRVRLASVNRAFNSILQQDPIRWALVTNIYISGQPMFRTEFIDKWNLKKLATGLSLTKSGLSTGRPFCRSRAGTRMVTFIFLYFYFYIFSLQQIFWNFGIICWAYI